MRAQIAMSRWLKFKQAGQVCKPRSKCAPGTGRVAGSSKARSAATPSHGFGASSASTDWANVRNRYAYQPPPASGHTWHTYVNNVLKREAAASAHLRTQLLIVAAAFGALLMVDFVGSNLWAANNHGVRLDHHIVLRVHACLRCNLTDILATQANSGDSTTVSMRSECCAEAVQRHSEEGARRAFGSAAARRDCRHHWQNSHCTTSTSIRRAVGPCLLPQPHCAISSERCSVRSRCCTGCCKQGRIMNSLRST